MPFCESCGAPLDEAMRFCAECGTPVTPAEPAPAAAEAPAAETPAAEAPVAVVAPAPAAVAAPVAVPAAEPKKKKEKPQKEKQKKEKSKKDKKPMKKGTFLTLLIGGIALITAGILAFLLFVLPMLRSEEKAPFALYLKNDNLRFADLDDPDDPYAYDVAWNLYSLFDGAGTTDDFGYATYDYGIIANRLQGRVQEAGDLLFYLDDYSSYGEFLSASLYCRGKDDERFDPFYIASNVKQFAVTPDGETVYYCTAYGYGDSEVGALYRYDVSEQESYHLSEDVFSFQLTEDGKTLAYGTLEDGPDASPYLRNHFVYNGSTVSLPPLSRLVGITDDCSVVFYTLSDGSTYRMVNGTNQTQVGNNISSVVGIAEDGSTFFYMTEGSPVTVKLSDFVTDDMKSADAALKPPAEPNEPQYPNSYDYYDSYGYIDWDRYNDAVDRYYEKMETYNEEYNKYQEKYRDYQSKVSAKNERDSLRRQLSLATTQVKKQALYYYDGVTQKLAESYGISIAAFDAKHNALVYESVASNNNPNKIKLSTLSSIDYLYGEVETLLLGSSLPYLSVGAKTTKIADKPVDAAVITEDGTLYYTVSVSTGSYSTLHKAKLDGNTLDVAETVCANTQAGIAAVIGNEPLYYSIGNAYTNYPSAELYLGTTLLDDDALIYEYEVYAETGTIAFLTDYSINSQSGTLCVYHGGSVERIASGVSDYSWTKDGTLLYLSYYDYSSRTGTLYARIDGTDYRIDDGVQAIIPTYF